MIVKSHQGQIWFESKEGEGTTFLSNYPCNRLRKKELMIRALKIYYLFIFTILVSCSSEDISQENLDIYIPFPYDSVERVSFKSSKILKNQKKILFLLDQANFKWAVLQMNFGRSNDETLHTVRITKPFWMGKFEVTVEEWNENLPHSLKYGSPIYNFSADHLEHFCKAENYTAGNYSLTEYEKSFVLEEVLPNQDVKIGKSNEKTKETTL